MRFSPSLLIRLSWGVLTVLSASGCGKTIISGMGPMTAQAAAAIAAYDDPDLLGKALPNNLITDEGYLGIAPDNVDLLVGTASTYSLYAAAFVEEIDQEHAKKLYLRGRELGLRALEQNPRFKKAVEQGSLEAFAAALESFKKKDVPALYVTMTNWLSWISLSAGDPVALMDLPRVEAIMNRILALDETYNFGAIHAAFGAYYGSLSPALGGQPEKSKHHFEKAFTISKSRFLYFHVLFAETYAVQIQDRALFVSTLKKVMNTAPDIDRKMTMANAIAKIQAEKLLKSVDEYFL